VVVMGAGCGSLEGGLRGRDGVREVVAVWLLPVMVLLVSVGQEMETSDDERADMIFSGSVVVGNLRTLIAALYSFASWSRSSHRRDEPPVPSVRLQHRRRLRCPVRSSQSAHRFPLPNS
jgi:hypothetical protein